MIVFDSVYNANAATSTGDGDLNDIVVLTLGETNNPRRREDPIKNMAWVVGVVPFLQDNSGQPDLSNTYWYGFQRCSMLKFTLDENNYRESGDDIFDHSSPGKGTYEPITLTKGIGKSTFLYSWANQCIQLNSPDEYNPMTLLPRSSAYYQYRVHHLRLVLRNTALQPVAAFKIYTPWVKEYEGTSDLDAGGNDVVTESIVIKHDGFRRFYVDENHEVDWSREWGMRP